jgi:hypothetical protein
MSGSMIILYIVGKSGRALNGVFAITTWSALPRYFRTAANLAQSKTNMPSFVNLISQGVRVSGWPRFWED